MTDEDDVPHFKFWEEPLGLPAAAGYGFFQGGPGDRLGHGNRFRLATKIGYGTTSSVWLAWDSSVNRHVAIKILSGHATQLNRENKLRELQIFQRLSAPTTSITSHFVRLLDPLYLPGIEDDGDHLCLVTELAGSLHFIQQQLPEYGYIPLMTAKRILRHILDAISYMHSFGIAHTDIKPDNVLVDLGNMWTSDAIEAWRQANPPCTYEPTRSLNKMVTSYVTQKFPPPPINLAQLSSASFKLSDFGSAQIVNSETTDHITPLDLRPPEIVLGGDWDQSVDIWTFGCLTFYILTRGLMFAPHPLPELKASIEDVLLFQMVCYSGETFKRDFLSRCRRTLEFFDCDCMPKKFDAYIDKGPVNCVREGADDKMSDADVHETALFLGKCLRLDPKIAHLRSSFLQIPG